MAAFTTRRLEDMQMVQETARLAMAMTILAAASANSAPLTWSCDVAVRWSGAKIHRDVTIDAGRAIVTDNGLVWRNGDPAPQADNQQEYVAFAPGLVTWGTRIAASGRPTAKFTLDLSHSEYTMSDPDVGWLADGRCQGSGPAS